MPNQYFENSKTIANDFIQSIVFIDDEANGLVVGTSDHQLNALEITKGFAKSQKICAVYSPHVEADLNDLINIGKKSDVLVLDWKITLEQKVVEGKEEEDVESVDLRGQYTIRIIKEILTDPDYGQGSLKLIFVYTGETNLWDITKSIFAALSTLPDVQHDAFTVFSANFKIVVIGKPMLTAKHLPEIEARIIAWDELPNFILKEFAVLTYGLLSSAVLLSLTAIRKKVFTLINTFPRTLDSAFLAHKALLPNPEDAEEQIIDIIGSEIKSVLKSFNQGYYISNEIVKDYVEETLEDKNYEFKITHKEQMPSLTIPETVDRSLLIKFLEVGIEKAFLKRQTPFAESQLFSGICHKIAGELYAADVTKADESNLQFALLTSVKTNYNINIEPVLTLGTILRSEKDNTYWLCMQPKCDSVRIENTRDFLFSPLIMTDVPGPKINFLVKHNGKYLFFKINYSLYKTKLVNFKANFNQTVKGVLQDGKVLIKGNPNFEWIGELKNDFSQSVSNDFSSEMSRVAMDHSEWLRRW
jgi:hypothetical protein